MGEVRADRGSTIVLSVYSSHLTCLLPQHGPGKKHHRPIVLEPWQWRCGESAPWSFLRGCLWSDGCSFVNGTGAYAYLTFDFFNLSKDIRGLFIAACDIAGIEYRCHATRVRVNRRASVARLVAEVGVKR